MRVRKLLLALALAASCCVPGSPKLVTGGVFPSAIPRTLFTTHKLPLAECPPGLRKNINQWSSKNMDAHEPFVYYPDPALPEYLAEHCDVPGCLEAYTELLTPGFSSGAAKADFFRVARLYAEGGTWFDSDMAPLRLSSCDLPDDAATPLVLYRYSPRNRVRYTLMSSAVGHPIIRRTLETVISNIQAAAAGRRKNPAFPVPKTLQLTGPINLARSICGFLSDQDREQLCDAGPDKAQQKIRGVHVAFGGRHAGKIAGVAHSNGTSRFWLADCKFGQSGYAYSAYLRDLASMNVSHHSKHIQRQDGAVLANKAGEVDHE